MGCRVCTQTLMTECLLSCLPLLACRCEEFWAMNPSGNRTNTTCNGISVGEPYRELRVYVDGQVAGFSPIYFSIYSGGVAPR